MINLTTREKHLIMILAALLFAGASYFFIISPVVSFKRNADKSYENNMAKISRLEEINNSYRNILAEKNRIDASTAQGAGLASLVDEIAGNLNISGNKTLKENPGIVHNGIQKITTEIKFEGIPISALLEFINRLENSNSTLKVKSIVITSGIKERSRYDAILTIVSLAKR